MASLGTLMPAGLHFAHIPSICVIYQRSRSSSSSTPHHTTLTIPSTLSYQDTYTAAGTGDRQPLCQLQPSAIKPEMARSPNIQAHLQKLDQQLKDGKVAPDAYLELRDMFLAQQNPHSRPKSKPKTLTGSTALATTKPRTPPPSLYKAVVVETAGESDVAPHADQATVARVKKCLERGHHPNTSESEAKAALLLASRLMKKADISQAQVLAHESEDEWQQRAGQSTVRIVRNDDKSDGKVNQNVYVSRLCWAMATFFDCKFYTQSYHDHKKLDILFYGIARNTVAAARAFEKCYNLVLKWSRNPKYKGARGQNSYCWGFSNELYSRARAEKDAEEAAVIQAEKTAMAKRLEQEAVQRRAELDRLTDPPSSETMVDLDSESEIEFPNIQEGEDPVKKDRMALFRQIFSCVGVNVFASGTASSGRLVNAINNHIYDLGLQSVFDDDEANTILDHLVQGEVIKEDRTSDLLTPSDAVLKEWGLDTGDHETDGVEDTGDDDFTEDADFHTNDTDLQTPDADLEKVMSALSQSLEQEDNRGPPSVFFSEQSISSEQEDVPEVQYKSHMELILKRDTFAKIAEDYLKAKNIKLASRRKRKIAHLDQDAYAQGRVDGKKVDVRGRKLIEE